jgi:hypothetical protein
MVPHETVWGMRPAGFHAFWGVPIGVYRMTGDEGQAYRYTRQDSRGVLFFDYIESEIFGFSAAQTIIILL